MGIGFGIVLILAGAIVFAINADIPYIENDILGLILIGLGLLTIALAFALNHQRANTSHTARVEERRIEGP